MHRHTLVSIFPQLVEEITIQSELLKILGWFFWRMETRNLRTTWCQTHESSVKNVWGTFDSGHRIQGPLHLWFNTSQHQPHWLQARLSPEKGWKCPLLEKIGEKSNWSYVWQKTAHKFREHQRFHQRPASPGAKRQENKDTFHWQHIPHGATSKTKWTQSCC